MGCDASLLQGKSNLLMPLWVIMQQAAQNTGLSSLQSIGVGEGRFSSRNVTELCGTEGSDYKGRPPVRPYAQRTESMI